MARPSHEEWLGSAHVEVEFLRSRETEGGPSRAAAPESASDPHSHSLRAPPGPAASPLHVGDRVVTPDGNGRFAAS